MPAGHYAVYAGGKGIGNGHAPAEVTGGNSVNLSLTLKMGKKADKVGGNGKAPRPEPAAQTRRPRKIIEQSDPGRKKRTERDGGGRHEKPVANSHGLSSLQRRQMRVTA